MIKHLLPWRSLLTVSDVVYRGAFRDLGCVTACGRWLAASLPRSITNWHSASDSSEIESSHSSGDPWRTIFQIRAMLKSTGRIIILAWTSIGVVSIWMHFHPLTKRIANESSEHCETEERKGPVRHIEALHTPSQLAYFSFYTKASGHHKSVTT